MSICLEGEAEGERVERERERGGSGREYMPGVSSKLLESGGMRYDELVQASLGLVWV